LRKNCGLVDEKVVTGIQIQHCLARSIINENRKITKEKTAKYAEKRDIRGP